MGSSLVARVCLMLFNKSMVETLISCLNIQPKSLGNLNFVEFTFGKMIDMTDMCDSV